MKKLNNKIITILEKNDWSVGEIQKQDNDFYIEIENFSPAGENLVETIFFDGTSKGFVSAFREYAQGFDPDEHAELYVNMRGKRGVPESIRELIDDADAIKNMFMSLADELEGIK